jgi:hypothetical protein
LALADRVDETRNFIGRRIAGAAGADEAVGRMAETFDDGVRVKVSVGEEQAAIGESAGDFG